MKAKNGQVALYLVLVLVAVTVLVIGNVVVFLAVRAKNRAMNAGDAAALAAAHRQAELLNDIGRLNLQHAEAEWVGDWERAREIVEKQLRLCFFDPLDCLRKANDAAKANGAQPDAKMAEIIDRHVDDISTKYIQNPDLYPEPWEGAWEKYADELRSIAKSGIYAGCDNVDFIDAVECFPLTSKSFYSAVAGEAWCKFVVAGWEWLLNCDSHNMPRPMERGGAVVVNSEFCSLHLKLAPLVLDDSEQAAFRELLTENGACFPPRLEGSVPKDDRPLDDPSRLYFFYDTEGVWRQWAELDPQSKFRMPVVGRPKPEFDVLGCTAVFRVTETMETLRRLLADDEEKERFARKSVAWNAAAKAFGTIRTEDGVSPVTHESARGLVLPAYEAVRLIPVGAANADGQDLSTADATWLDHVRDHVPAYCADGMGGLSSGCPYCSCLMKWEDPEYRAKAAAWIAANEETCTRGSGGSGPTGGTAYAR